MRKAAWLAGLGAALSVGLILDRHARDALARRSRVPATPSGAVEVEITGAGPDVLVLHGSGGGFDQGTWLAHVLGLHDYRVISLSRPGYLGTPELETNDQAVALVVAALDALGVGRAAVIGASGGGMLAYSLAARHPMRVSALVMLSAVSGPVTNMGLPLAGYVLRTTFDVNRVLASAMRSPTGRRLVGELARTLAAAERRLPGVLLDIAISRSLLALEHVAAPTLVIHGTPTARSRSSTQLVLRPRGATPSWSRSAAPATCAA